MKTIQPVHLLISLIFAGLIGCGEAPAPEPQTETTNAPHRPVPEVLDPSYGHVVAPSGTLLARQVGAAKDSARAHWRIVVRIDRPFDPDRRKFLTLEEAAKIFTNIGG